MMINIQLHIFQSTWLVAVEITLLFLYCLAALPPCRLSEGENPSLFAFFPGGAGIPSTQLGQNVAAGPG